MYLLSCLLLILTYVALFGAAVFAAVLGVRVCAWHDRAMHRVQAGTREAL